MGLGSKIKSALHGDSHSQARTSSRDSYDDGRLPGSFPSDGVAGDKNTTANPSPSTNGAVNPTAASTAGRTANGHSTLKKGSHHQRNDSGVDFVEDQNLQHTKPKVAQVNGNSTTADYQRPVSRDGGIGAIDSHRHSNSAANKSDPYWGNIKNSGYERDVPHRPVSQVERDLNTIENGTYGSSRDLDSRNDTSRASGYSPTTTEAGGLTNGLGARDDLHGSKLTTHGAGNLHSADASRNRDLHNVGLADPREPVLGDSTHDERWRARDRGYSPVNGSPSVGNKSHHMAATADRHHQLDMHESGFHNNNNTTATTNGDLDGYNGHSGHNNHVNGSSGVVYGRSASVRNSPTRGAVNRPGQGSPAHGSSQPSSHFVPRVVHTCHNCGVDNDISQYFRPDVSYRLG